VLRVLVLAADWWAGERVKVGVRDGGGGEASWPALVV